jgi:hypothetical protein
MGVVVTHICLSVFQTVLGVPEKVGAILNEPTPAAPFGKLGTTLTLVGSAPTGVNVAVEVETLWLLASPPYVTRNDCAPPRAGKLMVTDPVPLVSVPVPSTADPLNTNTGPVGVGVTDTPSGPTTRTRTTLAPAVTLIVPDNAGSKE